MALRDRIAKARRKFWDFWRKRRKAKPGGKRRKKAKRKQDFWDALKEKLVKHLKRRQRGPKPGTGPWDGSQSVGEKVVVRIAKRFGTAITSRKRSPSHPLSLSNPSSDHNEANTTAYAWDIGTYNGAPIAHAIAKALGISGYSTGNYSSYYLTRNGIRFRVQILWAVSGHFNHVHVGIRRA